MGRRNFDKGMRRLAVGVAGALAAAAVVGVTPRAALADETGTGSTAAAVTGGAGFLAPYYTTGDVTGDDQITGEDLDLVAGALGTTSADAGWDAVSAADLDENGVIELTDVADLSQRVLYDDGSFSLVEASALDMQKAMNAGVLTSVELTQAYLDRIAAYDTLADDTHSRALHSIISTGGEAALAAAAESDAYRAENGGPRSMLDGIPIIVKDNYNTADMPTTGGCGCWDENQTADDAFMVEGMRAEGAVILAKATLDEFAFGFSSEYSSFQPAGTSTLVASPYNLARTAGGSSGGTGASIAANLGAIGFGTDTGGSIRVPSSYNQLVGIRPTVGLSSRDGIIPLALSQDTGGPIARTVADAAVALDAVTGVDAADPVTSEQTGLVPESYTSYLDPEGLEGVSLGYLTSMIPTNAAALRLFNEAVADLQAAGATVTPITTTALNSTLNEGSGSTNEFNHDLNAYIASFLDADVAARSLQGIIDSGKYVPSRLGTYNSRKAITQAQYETWMGTHTAAIANGEVVTTQLMDENGFDALIYPSGVPYGTYSTNMRLSPNTGMPSVTVPMGQANATESVPDAGVNLEFLGRNYAEGDLIAMTYAYEQATAHRTTPSLYPTLATDPTGGADPAPGDGAGGYTVTVSDDAVEIGDEVTVTVSATNADDLYAYGLSLDVDPEVLQYVDGSATGTEGGMTWAESPEAGTVDVVHTELGSSPASAGETVLATLTFEAVGEGSTDVTAAALESVSTALVSTTATDVAATPVAVDLLAAPVATTEPSITGTPVVGGRLTADGGEWDLDDVELSYTWLRDGATIPGATGTTYKATVADQAANLSVLVQATLPDHATGEATSAATGNVARATTMVRLTPQGIATGTNPRVTVRVTAPGIVPAGTVQVRYAGALIARAATLDDGRVVVRLPKKKAGTYGLKVAFSPDAGFKADNVLKRVTVR